MEWLRRNELKWQLLVAALLAMISLLHMDAASPQGIPSYDAGVFNYVGMVIQHGGMPYVDVFDHKGPLIYLINALAVEFGSWRMVAASRRMAWSTFRYGVLAGFKARFKEVWGKVC